MSNVWWIWRLSRPSRPLFIRRVMLLFVTSHDVTESRALCHGLLGLDDDIARSSHNCMAKDYYMGVLQTRSIPLPTPSITFF